ncbi:hypothetical protein [Saccharopolyspora shandongensis]|uniref:hypothetical protein n=1 Tax=Saccharopolyspora shandongensis TaxID=418495 RepID=UPI0033D64AB0
MDISTTLKKLEKPATVTFQSTQQLARQVRHRAKKLDEDRAEREQPPHERKLHLTPVLERENRHGMSVAPWEVLQALGRATALAGHGSSRALAQHWNCLRYITALQANYQGRLELSEDGKDPRYHRKSVQAQDLGIAFGLVAAQRIMQQRHPDYRFDPIDADVVLEAGWALRGSGNVARENTKIRPNYFLVGQKPGAPLRIASIDCKGSHGRPEAQHDQLARSAAHVRTVVIGEIDEGGGSPPSLLMATGLAAKGGIEVRLLDPDGDGLLPIPGKPFPDLTEPAGQLNLLPLVSFTTADGGRATRPGFSVPAGHSEWFSRVLARTTAAALLTFAGDRSAAHNLLTTRQRYRLGSAHSHASSGMLCDTGINLAGRKFVGTDHVFRLDGRRMEVFSGIAEPMYRLLVDQKLDDHEAALPAVLKDWEQRKTAAEKDWGGVVHLDPAGALFAIRPQGAGRQELL